MATLKDWVEGIRLRTLPASLSPVIIGAGIAAAMEEFSWARTLLALAVAVFLQIAANLSNDYSDGVRGTDDFREGPPRLTGGHKVEAKTVLLVAIAFYALSCIAGLILVWLSGHWWLLLLGVASVLAAWFYTGGKHPYGYTSLSELFVLIFFGYGATVGTVYVQTDEAPVVSWILATGVGFVACALLMVNNIRDIPTDEQAGKKTLAVRIGQNKARWSYYVLMALAVVLASSVYLWNFGIFVGMLAMLVWVVFIARPVISGATGKDLLPALRNTAIFELVYAVLIAAGLSLNHYYPSDKWATAGWIITAGVWIIWLVVEVVFGMIRSRQHKDQDAEQLSAQASQLDSEQAGQLEQHEQPGQPDSEQPDQPAQEAPDQEKSAEEKPASEAPAHDCAYGSDCANSEASSADEEKNNDLGLA